MKTIIDPTRIYEISGQSYKVLSAYLSTTAASNQQVVAGIAGQRIRVMGLAMQSQASTIGGVNIINGSGGAALMSLFPPSNAQPPLVLPLTDAGYFETTEGTGLFVNTPTQEHWITVFYIAYTP